MTGQMEPRKRNIFAIFKPKDFTANAKQSKNPPKKNNVSKIFSAMSKLFKRAGQTDNSSASLLTLTPKNVEFFPNSQELSPRVSRIFPELESPSPKIKEVQNDLVFLSQRCEELPLTLMNKKLCQNVALISPDLTKLSPGVNTLSPIRGNMPFDGSELCLKKKRNVMPEVFIYPTEICPSSPDIKQVNEQEEVWPNVLSPSPHEREAISTQSTKLSPEGHEISLKNDKSGPKRPFLSAIPEELFPKQTTLSPIGDKLSFMPSESSPSRQNVSPDIPMNPPAFGKILLQDVPKTREKVKARRYQSNPLQRKGKEPLRPRFVSEPCGNTYTQLMEKQGAKLTNAAYELTEEQSRLLYEDMFKPLDVFALI